MSLASGRFLLRVSPDLHRRLRERAASEGISLNSLCVKALEAAASPPAEGSAGVPCDLPLPAELARGVFETWRDSLIGIVAFGSVVRGEAAAGSDLDLLIVLERGSAVERSLYDRWSSMVAERRIERADRVSPQFVALPDSVETAGGLWLEVAREGRLVLDRDGRLVRFLASLRDFMMSGKVVRRTVHGQPYWLRARSSR